MPLGTVKWFNTTKGFGFIEPEGGGNDVFVHISAVERAGMTSLADNQKINYKVREHSVAKVPVILAVGMKEVADRTLSMRRLGSKNSEVVALDQLVAKLKTESTPPDLL